VIIEQLKKLFRVYGCSAEEQLLLIQTSTIPNIHFIFEQAKKWFGLKNRTLLNHLEKHGWLKKEALYDNGRNRYRYFMHSVIAAAVRAQFMDELYDACQGFIREITVEMKDSLSQNDNVKKELIQFSWSLNDIFQGQFQSESDCDFIWALAEIYRDMSCASTR
jgi:predicted transcriptional regulator